MNNIMQVADQTLTVTLMSFKFTFVALIFSTLAQANTEIRNFAATESPVIKLPDVSKWHVLSYAEPSLYLNITSAQNNFAFERQKCAEFEPSQLTGGEHDCPHQLWVLLDTEAPQWSGYSKFTFRASWPAHQPTDISMDILDPITLESSTLKTNPKGTTRRKIARLRFVHTGVLTPTHQSVEDDSARYLVSVHLILEPLLFGVLPQTVVPVVIAILAILACGIPISRRIAAHLQGLAKEASTQLKTVQQKNS